MREQIKLIPFLFLGCLCSYLRLFLLILKIRSQYDGQDQ
jgi:hypothetical protein